jgi:hypothetical protein
LVAKEETSGSSALVAKEETSGSSSLVAKAETSGSSSLVAKEETSGSSSLVAKEETSGKPDATSKVDGATDNTGAGVGTETDTEDWVVALVAASTVVILSSSSWSLEYIGAYDILYYYNIIIMSFYTTQIII